MSEERSENFTIRQDNCPECGKYETVIHLPGMFPVCEACGWTGWDQDDG